MDRKELIAGVKAVSCIAPDKARGAVRLDIHPLSIQLAVSVPDMGTAQIGVPCDNALGHRLEIGFNGSYLIGILSEMETETVEFVLADPGSPTLIRERDGAATLYVLMPMRV